MRRRTSAISTGGALLLALMVIAGLSPGPGGAQEEGVGTGPASAEPAATEPAATEPPSAEPATTEPPSAEAGTIRGTVKSLWVSRVPGVVYVERIDGMEFAPPAEHPVMDQKNLVYEPHILPILVGSTVDFPNSDTVRHSVFSTRNSSTVFNLGTYEKGIVKELLFDTPGVTTLLCNVHSEMVAYVLVLETPFHAFTDRRKQFVLEGVPAGQHRVTFWHEKLRPQTIEVEVRAGETTEVVFEKLKAR